VTGAGREFTCARCGLVVHTHQPVEETLAEAKAEWGPAIEDPADRVSLCDDCYTAFMAWWKAQQS
jgi:hypothetical protein